MYNTNLGTMVGYFNYQGAQEIEQEGVLQTLYLMNPAGYPGYEATPNILLLNSAAAASVPPSLNPLLSHASAAPSTSNSMHQSLGIPLLPAPSHYISSSLQAFNSNQNPRLWSSAMPPHQLGLRQQQQGLSLSLSPHHRAPIAASASSETGPSNGVSDAQRFWMGSRYLKVAQQLLEEVVSAGNEAKEGVSTKGSESKCHELRSAKAAEFGKNEKAASDLTTSERQDLHMKNVKLVSMLEEVEQRYKLYHHHIQTIVLSFEGATGSGAARTYTALALQTISKHFRWLKDVISAQIRGNAKRLLGEEAGSSLLGEDINKSSSGSRLRLIDQQLRQKRAFRMAQHNAWRPQRGLPECSVSILRAWLFEHFLHPYPKDSDKQLLAKQTGLTRSQVSNWFINARVRLWKPMVEEMYMEDQLKGGDITINIGDENSSSTSSSSRSKNNTNYNGAESTSKSPPHELSALLPAQHSDTNMQQHSMKNMDFGVVMDGRDDDDDDDEGELMIKFGMGLHDEKDIEDRRSLLQYGISGYSPMSRKLNGDDAYPGAGQAVERLISEELLLLTHPARTLMMNKQSVALTLGLPHHAAADDNNNNNNNNNNVRVQSFLSSTYCS